MTMSVSIKSHRTHHTARILLAILAAAVLLLAPSRTRASRPAPPLPDLGPNVLIFSPSTPPGEMQKKIDAVYAIQRDSQFGSARYALLFLPGQYHADVPVGYYTQVAGLGVTPDAVRITGNVHADASLPRNNATCTFWRDVEGFSVTPTGGTMQWAVSQAAPFRRMHILGNLVLNQHNGWASGGWISDSLIDGNVASGSQQQWISRNSQWRSWTGSNWNMVFVGIPNPPAGEWPQPPYTKVARTPVVREKPFLQVDVKGNWSVRMPALEQDSVGITWRGGSTPGRSIPLSSFYIARPGSDSAASINAQLARGKNLLLTPGIYDLAEPIRVTRTSTIVLGLGFATLRPTRGTAAMTTADAGGIEIAGVLFDAGPQESPVLLEVGPPQSKANHVVNPIVLHDVFFRVGGAGVGRTRTNLIINSNNTIVDHTWIWRADHGSGVGWNQNISDNGLVVNGDNVTIYGLFVEHHQQFQVLWNGNGGRTYFYQSEIPYDPPDQASYASAPGTDGWASYKVADSVTTHEAWGLGIYSVFLHPNVNLTRAIQVPRRPGVRFHHIITVALGDMGAISNVIDNTGGPTSIHPRVTPKVAEFP
ncbi:MAG TPA: coagulation factor 5/8 type domain-containing protein [Terracidiphilus sp.]|nr:coagulation factor 5/8 type domain-containing protein [Terracidiphilus sp.]